MTHGTRTEAACLAASMAETPWLPLHPDIRDAYLTGAISTAIDLIESGWTTGVLEYLRVVEARAKQARP